MEVIVTGCDGYLGFPLSLHLLSQGHEVVGIDNLSRRRRVREVGSHSATPIYSPFERFMALHEEFPEFKWRIMDLRDYGEVDYVFDKYKPDAVVHLGEIPSAPYSMIDVEHCNETQMNNIVGTNNILFAMKKHAPNCHLLKLGCYDRDTDVLTRNGWKKFEELSYYDEVCCLDPETEEIVYHPPTHIVKYPYKGKMMSIKTQNMDFLITPNHRVVYRYTGQQYENNAGPLHIEQASEVFGKNFSIPKTGTWKGEEVDHFQVPEISVRHYYGKNHLATAQVFKMDSWLRFFGWFITEGCIRYRSDEPTAVYISQTTGSKNASEIRESIRDLNLNAQETIRKDKRRPETIITTFEISNNHIANYLEKFGKARGKYIPKELKNLSRRQLSILFDSLIKGDGHISKKTGSIYYFSKSDRLLGDVQEIAIKLGYEATICTYEKEGRKEKYVCFSKHPNAVTKRQSQTWVPYEGFVHCCTVPTGIIMVRRNGKSAFSGNTMGEYGVPDLPIPEGFFEIEYRGRRDRLPFPRQPGSWYHLSKVHDTHNIMFACKIWGLRSTDVMQGVVHGVVTDEMIDDDRLLTRFDFDEAWGTALNRFCAQAVIGHELTPYGKGGQTRGYLALRDSMQCLTLAAENPPDEGEYRVFNQFEECYSVNELAEHVVDVSSEFGIEAKIWNIENPRIEAEEHFYEPDMKHLPELGFKPTYTLDDELRISIPKLMKYKDRIEAKKDHIMPTIKWRK